MNRVEEFDWTKTPSSKFACATLVPTFLVTALCAILCFGGKYAFPGIVLVGMFIFAVLNPKKFKKLFEKEGYRPPRTQVGFIASEIITILVFAFLTWFLCTMNLMAVRQICADHQLYKVALVIDKVALVLASPIDDRYFLVKSSEDADALGLTDESARYMKLFNIKQEAHIRQYGQ